MEAPTRRRNVRAMVSQLSKNIKRRQGILNNTAIGDRTQDHFALSLNKPFFCRKFKNQKENTKKEGKKILFFFVCVWCNDPTRPRPSSFFSIIIVVFVLSKKSTLSRGVLSLDNNRLLKKKKKKNLRRRRRRYRRRRRSQKRVVIGKKEKEGKRRTPTPRKKDTK